MTKLSPIKVMAALPSTNCKECGEETCMAFAVKLIDHQVNIDDCKPLFREAKYAKKLEKLKELITPPIRKVVVGSGDNAMVVGDEEVMYRHELTYYSPTPICIEVADDDLDEVARIAKYVNDYSLYRIGQTFYLDGVAIRCRSNDAKTFTAAVKKAMESTKKPLVLCSINPEILRAGAKAAKGRNPLLYAATKDNWEEVGKIAQEFNCPVVVHSPDLSELKSLAATFYTAGIEQIVLDPGTYHGAGNVADTYAAQVQLKRSAIDKEDKLVGFPTLGVTATAFIGKDKNVSEADRVALAYEEAKMATLLICNACNMLIMHTSDNWFLLAMMVVRENIYSDPRIHPAVDAKIYEVGSPTADSPVFVTTNYTMTYFTVRSDLQDLRLDAWLLCIDTEGISVESSVAGGQMTAPKVAEALKETGMMDKVNHKIVIIPGLAARISGELEDLSKVKVVVGPRDSSGIDKLMKTYDKDKLMKEWKEIQES